MTIFYLELFSKESSSEEPLGYHKQNKRLQTDSLNGVYVLKSIINQTVFGMMNIGFNPTVSGENIDRNPF
jgi:riboflavin kinase/FMN adenylyltransferase